MENEPKGPKSAEQLSQVNAELEAQAAERLKSFENRPEANPELAHEQIESARSQIEQAKEPIAPESQPPAVMDPIGSGMERTRAYKETMASLYRGMKPGKRSFSKFIHAPAVEAISEVAAKSVFRPSVTLGATLGALTIGGFLYVTARTGGFALSGSEFILSLIVGGLVGGLIELGSKLLRRHKS